MNIRNFNQIYTRTYPFTALELFGVSTWIDRWRWARSRGSSKSSLRSWRRIWAVFQEGNGIHYRFLPWSGRCAPVVFACHSTEGSQTARNTLTLGLTLYIAGKQKEISWKLKQRRRSGRLS